MTSDTYDADALGPLDPDGADADPGATAERTPSTTTEVSTPKTKPLQVLTDIGALQRERDDLLEMSKRLQADFENYRKRVLREQTVLVERASEGIVEQLLPVLDSFELAPREPRRRRRRQRWSPQGHRARVRRVARCARAGGLEPMAADGAPFDPNEHEAVMHDDGDGEPTVGGVLRTGWRLKGRVLRPAMVKVVR